VSLQLTTQVKDDRDKTMNLFSVVSADLIVLGTARPPDFDFQLPNSSIRAVEKCTNYEPGIEYHSFYSAITNRSFDLAAPPRSGPTPRSKLRLTEL
jgi:hypothetical protein